MTHSSTEHPLQSGQTFLSPGGHFTYRVVGPCCRLFDRDELPWPCCRLQWRGKEPSWRRIGKRFVPDLATRNSPSYAVEVIGSEGTGRSFVVTLYPEKLSPALREWWYSKHSTSTSSTSTSSTSTSSTLVTPPSQVLPESPVSNSCID